MEAELKANPTRSDREIAETAGAFHPFVGRIRQRLETGGVVTVTTPSERISTNGKVGEGQRKPRGASVEKLREMRRHR
ncbi:hypothetical protein CQ12_05505 [Bradyrhizobium jicamae]|uniref:Uncharacterized protein n=1 Tax=Bradyrhizobium jicamae TaxID=280332 RepID=A0A0R3M1F4_9BRAD|nr:hypothetical protein CQ12_05505 [Bradyrhizobium jicamae]